MENRKGYYDAIHEEYSITSIENYLQEEIQPLLFALGDDTLEMYTYQDNISKINIFELKDKNHINRVLRITPEVGMYGEYVVRIIFDANYCSILKDEYADKDITNLNDVLNALVKIRAELYNKLTGGVM